MSERKVKLDWEDRSSPGLSRFVCEGEGFKLQCCNLHYSKNYDWCAAVGTKNSYGTEASMKTAMRAAVLALAPFVDLEKK